MKLWNDDPKRQGIIIGVIVGLLIVLSWLITGTPFAADPPTDPGKYEMTRVVDTTYVHGTGCGR